VLPLEEQRHLLWTCCCEGGPGHVPLHLSHSAVWAQAGCTQLQLQAGCRQGQLLRKCCLVCRLPVWGSFSSPEVVTGMLQLQLVQDGWCW
jgi:hypothetical protein